MTTPVESSYFKDLGRAQTLTAQEEIALIQILRDPDKKDIHGNALRRLICGNLRFVVSVARKYQGRGLELLDLINEGNLGLFKAAMRFDCGKDVRFISYAVWWIRQAIQKAIFDRVGTMRIPPNKLILVSRFKKALFKNFGDYDKTFEMPEFSGCEREIIDTLEKMTEISLDAVPADSGGTESGSLLDILESETYNADDKLKEEERRQAVNEILMKLSPKEGNIVKMFYGIDAADESTLRDIGNELNISKEKVRQIKNKALRKMQRNKELHEQIRDYL